MAMETGGWDFARLLPVWWVAGWLQAYDKAGVSQHHFGGAKSVGLRTYTVHMHAPDIIQSHGMGSHWIKYAYIQLYLPYLPPTTYLS